MVPRDIRNHRLVNQQIASAVHKNPCDVVASLAAVQAQDYAGALWAIGLRLPDATEADIKQAVAERTIIRTWMMRGTLHFVATADVRWMRDLLAPQLVLSSAHRCEQLELTTKIFGRREGACLKALEGGRKLTRGEIYKVLERSRISTTGQRGAHILWRLAQDGVICFGAHAGKQQTFVLLNECAPNAKKVERDQALAELARRYFSSHGPATLQDFGRWSGLKAADARAAVEMASSKLARETMDGKVYWMPQDRPDKTDAPSAVNLLPGFDEYLIGYKDRSASLDPRHVTKILPGNNGMLLPTVVGSGRVVGTWKRAFKKNAVSVTASFFRPPKKGEARAVAETAERYGRFLGMAVGSCSSKIERSQGREWV
jgi:Winged helix DNA-binding domain